MDLVEFVSDQLHSTDIEVVEKSNNLWIPCPYHAGGHERTPSMKVNISEPEYGIGNAFCFGCGAHPKWNELAETLGMRKMRKSEMYEEYARLNLSAEQLEYILDEKPPESRVHHDRVPWPSNKVWRTIPGSILSELGSEMTIDRFGHLKLVLPVVVNGVWRGEITCLMEKSPSKKVPSYINKKGPWRQSALFPYDYVQKRIRKDSFKIVFLCEGPRDSLRLNSCGAHALALLGSSTSWTEAKGNMVLALDPDVVVLAFDPDEPGQKAYRKANHFFNDKVKTIHLTFQGSDDPATMTAEEVHDVIRRIRRKRKSHKDKAIADTFSRIDKECGLI